MNTADRLADLASQAAVQTNNTYNTARALEIPTQAVEQRMNDCADLAARAADQLRESGR